MKNNYAPYFGQMSTNVVHFDPKNYTIPRPSGQCLTCIHGATTTVCPLPNTRYTGDGVYGSLQIIPTHTASTNPPINEYAGRLAKASTVGRYSISCSSRHTIRHKSFGMMLSSASSPEGGGRFLRQLSILTHHTR